MNLPRAQQQGRLRRSKVVSVFVRFQSELLFYCSERGTERVDHGNMSKLDT